jgi:hypothetical protein
MKITDNATARYIFMNEDNKMPTIMPIHIATGIIHSDTAIRTFFKAFSRRVVPARRNGF